MQSFADDLLPVKQGAKLCVSLEHNKSCIALEDTSEAKQLFMKPMKSV